MIAAAAVFAVSGLLVCRVGSAITGASTVNYSVPLAGGGLGVAILDEHPGVAEFVVLATMLGVLVLIGGQSNKPSTSAIP